MKIRKQLRDDMTNLERLRISENKTQQEMANLLKCTAKTYANYEKGKQEPFIKHLLTLAEHFGVSTDYILNRSTCTAVTNHYINKLTGLDDAAIQGLQELLLSDQNAVKNQQPDLCVLPVLNKLLGSGIDTEHLLNAVRDYFSPGYNVPVYHDGTGNINSQGVLSPACIIPNNIYDKMGAAYLLHLAKSEDAPDDNITVPISEDFLKAVALKQIEQALIELKNNIK